MANLPLVHRNNGIPELTVVLTWVAAKATALGRETIHVVGAIEMHLYAFVELMQALGRRTVYSVSNFLQVS
eukprot:SM000002S05687  [mRNA]  locus=s2:1614638:1615120:+ [translate_table: standard]